MRRFLHPLIAVLTALLLLGSQQAALAHMIGHVGAATQAAAQPDDDSHGAALTLSHVCTTCIAFAALDAAPPLAPPAPLAVGHAVDGTAPVPPQPVALTATTPYRSRAPPSL